MRIDCFVLWHYYDEDGNVMRASSTIVRDCSPCQLQECLMLNPGGKMRSQDEAPYSFPVQVIFLPETFERLITWQENGEKSVSWFSGNRRALQEHLEKHQRKRPSMIPMQIMDPPVSNWMPIPLAT